MGIWFALYVGAEDVEVVGEGEGFEDLEKGEFRFADILHGELVVEVDEVVCFLYDVGVVIGVLVDVFGLWYEYLYFGLDDVHLYFGRLICFHLRLLLLYLFVLVLRNIIVGYF